MEKQRGRGEKALPVSFILTRCVMATALRLSSSGWDSGPSRRRWTGVRDNPTHREKGRGDVTVCTYKFNSVSTTLRVYPCDHVV